MDGCSKISLTDSQPLDSFNYKDNRCLILTKLFYYVFVVPISAMIEYILTTDSEF